MKFASLSILLSISLLVFVTTEHVTPGQRVGGRKTASGAFLEINDAKLRDELHQAVQAALGAGHDLETGRLRDVRRGLEPIWLSVAKNEHNRIDRRTLRYLLHRHLLKQRSLSIVGLEPLQSGATQTSVAALLTDRAPAYVKAILEGGNAEKGFSIDDTVAMVALMEELVANSDYSMLETLYRDKGWSLQSAFNVETFDKMLSLYLLRWMMGSDEETIELLESNETLMEESFDNWNELVSFVKGHRIAFERSVQWRGKDQTSWKPLNPMYSYADAQAVVSSIVLNFGRFWHTECARVKDLLLTMDYTSTGRVKLSDFHGAALNGEWRFGESKDYLRQLGALDESSTLLGPRLIIPNYLQGASNCIISDKLYRVCCVSDCEELMAEIEAAVQGPLASPLQIINAVENITKDLDDNRVKLTRTMKAQLEDLSSTHNGQVPLHGRLFAQWLHYVFPQDCIFPHKAGTVSSISPLEFGNDYMASEEEIAKHASDSRQGASDSAVHESDELWMTQWSEEEELLTENIKMHAPWEVRMPLQTLGAMGFAVAVVLSLLRARSWGSLGVGDRTDKDVGMFSAAFSSKAHFV